MDRFEAAVSDFLWPYWFLYRDSYIDHVREDNVPLREQLGNYGQSVQCFLKK